MKNFFSALIILFSVAASAQSFSIGHRQITFNDPARGGRAIQTEVYYPATAAGTATAFAAGEFPIIVFGHGFVMAWDSYQNIWDELVPRGYILAFPRTEGSISPNHLEFSKDLSFLVNEISAQSLLSTSVFYNHVSAKSAIMGHSMGGGSSFLAANGNSNITTMVSFAAANTSPSAITAAAGVTVPTLVFSGENDCVAPLATNQQPLYDSLGAACRAMVVIRGAAHCEFANYNFNCSFGQSTCSPSPAISGAEQKSVMNAFLDPWLDYYLKDDCAALNTFNDSLQTSPRIIGTTSCASMAAPVISLAGTILSSTPALTWQWLLNGVPVPGAVAQNYSPAANGNYSVQITNDAGCTLTSNVIYFGATGIEEEQGPAFTINAASDILLSNVNVASVSKLQIYDLQGREIFSKQPAASERIDISFLSSGTYILTLSSSKGRKCYRFVR